MAVWTTPLQAIDRFGDPPPRPKAWPTGILTLALYTLVIMYSVFAVLSYVGMPATQENDVLWSSFGGPYPLTLTCAAETCWASMSFRGAYAPCLEQVPSEQRDTCIQLSHGESVTLSTCFALLPSEGVRLYFANANRQQWTELAPETGMGGAPDAEQFGFYSVSDMLMEDSSVMPTNAPLRAGATLLNYVHTINGSVADEGRDRHEWFSQTLDSDPPAEPENAPCASLINSAGSVRVSVLRMAPAFTSIEVSPPPSSVAALLGEIGGTIAACDEMFSMMLAVWLHVSFFLLQRDRRPAQGREPDVETVFDKGTTAVSPIDGVPQGLEEHVQQLIARATADLTQRLAVGEAALARHEQCLEELTVLPAQCPSATSAAAIAKDGSLAEFRDRDLPLVPDVRVLVGRVDILEELQATLKREVADLHEAVLGTVARSADLGAGNSDSAGPRRLHDGPPQNVQPGAKQHLVDESGQQIEIEVLNPGSSSCSRGCFMLAR